MGKGARRIPILGVLAGIYALIPLLGDNPLPLLLATIQLPSGVEIRMTLADLFIPVGIVGLYIDLVLAARTSRTAVIEGVPLSQFVCIGCIALFMLRAETGTWQFGMLTLMSVIGMLADFMLTRDDRQVFLGEARTGRAAPPVGAVVASSAGD